MAIAKGLEMLHKIEGLLSSEDGQALMARMETPPPQLIQEISAPFLWPLSKLMLKGGLKGTKDYLSADKRFVRLFCLQLLFVNLHGLLAAGGLTVIAASIAG